jgi:hypothetical protein
VLLLTDNILQHAMNLMKMEPDDVSETCLSCSYNESELLDIKEDGDPLSITFPVIKTEDEVSFCMHPSTRIVHGLLV